MTGCFFFLFRLIINRAEPNSTKTMEKLFSIERFSEKTNVPARIGIAAPRAALKGIIKRARPLVKAI